MREGGTDLLRGEGSDEGDQGLLARLQQRGITRREFMKFCALVAGVLALRKEDIPRVAAALQQVQRQPLIWLEFQDCAGCTESFLRSPHPTIAEIVLDLISLNYQETIMAAAGQQAEASKQATISAGGYLLAVEGAIPTKDGGVGCCVSGRAATDLIQEAASRATAIIAVGSCASFGNIPAAYPNPTGAVGVRDLVARVPIINLSGCPVNAVNLAATVAHYLTFKSLPELDNLGRPLFGYGERVHDHCERRAHFDSGEYVESWGDQAHRMGWCLYKMGCKGPDTYHNCPVVRYNEHTNWPVGAGHGCIGCSEPKFWDAMTPFYRRLPSVNGFGVEANVERIAAGLTAVTAAAIVAHAVGSAVRRKPKPAAGEAGPDSDRTPPATPKEEGESNAQDRD